MTVDEILDHVITEPNTGCWIWDGRWDQDGYGLSYRDQCLQGAHRAVYKALVGPIPDGMQIHHRCCVKCCVNPVHLEVVTLQENLRRRRERSKTRRVEHYDGTRNPRPIVLKYLDLRVKVYRLSRGE